MAGSTQEEAVYEIRVQDHLDSHWSAWLGGLTLAHEQDGTSLLTGPLPDQAALYGLLERMCDLGLTLLSVHRVDPTDSAPGVSQQGDRP